MKENFLTLNLLPIGKRGRIISLCSTGNERNRMLDLGLINGTTIEALHKSPSGDPVAYFFRGSVIALREDDAAKILISANT